MQISWHFSKNSRAIDSFALRTIGCFVLYPNVLLFVLSPNLKILSFRKCESGRSLSLDDKFLFLFKRAIEGPNEVCCDTWIRWFLVFSTSLMLSALLDLVRKNSMNRNTWAVVFNNFVHFENFLAATTGWIVCRTIVVFVFSALRKVLQFSLFRTKMLVGLANAL